MKKIITRFSILIICFATSLPNAQGMGFHGGGGFRGGGFSGGGFHGGGFSGGGFDGGGFRGGGFSGGDFSRGGFSAPSFNNSSFDSSFRSSFSQPDFRTSNFDNFRAPSSFNERPNTLNFAGEGFNNFSGNHGGMPSLSTARPNGINFYGNTSASQLGHFLGIPVHSTPGGGLQTAAGTRVDTIRPESFNRPAAAGYAGNRPAWSGAGVGPVNPVQSKFASAVRPGEAGAGRMNNWLQAHPARADQWSNWANDVKNGGRIGSNVRPGSDWWSKYHPAAAASIENHFNPLRPGSDWWSKYHPNLAPWYYHHDWANHNWRYWWGDYPWSNYLAWFPDWGDPLYYDYGTGGNVVYQDNSVYVNGQDVGTQEQYAQSAADLATVPPPTDDSAQPKDQFLPLGTYSVSTSKDDTAPTRILQLAIDKQGIISGSLFNSSTNQSYIVQGRADKKTQRVAFTIGDNANTVLETGIYNLLQKETPVLVHYGDNKTETYLLVRLQAPPAGAADPTAPKPTGTQSAAPSSAD